LTNAIYFKGDWENRFKEEQTRDADFFVSANRKETVRMMNQIGRFKYLQEKDFQALELPYAGNELSMTVLLPNKTDGLAELERSLAAKDSVGLPTGLYETLVAVSLPKFKTTQEFVLNNQLSKMGMPDAFDDRADFSGMNDRKDLKISVVVHKAFVDV